MYHPYDCQSCGAPIGYLGRFFKWAHFPGSHQCKNTLDPYKYKQILVVRKDLNMRKGKIAAQCAHASLAAYLENPDDDRMVAWLKGPFTKICVSVDSEEDILRVEKQAKAHGLITRMIVDAGRTEFNGIPTRTVLAIGPDTHEALEPITGHLKLI